MWSSVLKIMALISLSLFFNNIKIKRPFFRKIENSGFIQFVILFAMIFIILDAENKNKRVLNMLITFVLTLILYFLFLTNIHEI